MCARPAAHFTRSTKSLKVPNVVNITQCLRSIRWDHNFITALGLRQMAAALDVNCTVLDMPLPINDIGQSLKVAPGETRTAAHRIQAALNANHSPAYGTAFAAARPSSLPPSEHLLQQLAKQVCQAGRSVNVPPIAAVHFAAHSPMNLSP